MNAQSALRDLKAGTQLANRYTLVRPLGRGGIAETWLASDRMTRANVALKILPSADANRGALHSEWQTSIRLMHPHIVRVFEFHDDAAGAFYSLQPSSGAKRSGSVRSLPCRAGISTASRATSICSSMSARCRC